MVHLHPVSCRFHWKDVVLFQVRPNDKTVKCYFLSQEIILTKTLCFAREVILWSDNTAWRPKITELDIWVTHLHLFSDLIKTSLPLNDIELMSSNRLISSILKADSRYERTSSIMLMNVYIVFHLGWEGKNKWASTKHHISAHISVSWDKFTIVWTKPQCLGNN